MVLKKFIFMFLKYVFYVFNIFIKELWLCLLNSFFCLTTFIPLKSCMGKLS